jgi:prolyl oligopeptidase
MLRAFMRQAAAAAALTAAATPVAALQADPFIWLEEVEGPRALRWVEEQNNRSVAALTSHPWYAPIYERTLQILDSRERIALPSILGESIYNFWQDADHPRGIWRRSTWQSYVAGTPAWETVLDVDELARSEGVPWAFGGATCLAPDYDRCLVRLSRGGADAVEIREFDMRSRRFMAGGFRLR